MTWGHSLCTGNQNTIQRAQDVSFSWDHQQCPNGKALIDTLNKLDFASGGVPDLFPTHIKVVIHCLAGDCPLAAQSEFLE